MTMTHLFVLLATMAQTPAAPATCGTPAHHALDFWIGRWTVTNPAGQPAGSSTVDPTPDGCGLIERYTGNAGPAGRRYLGTGLHVFDATSNAWRQLFSDNRPAATAMTGRVVDGTVVYEWDVVEASKHVPKRYTLSRTDSGVRQLGERSDDGGKTWTMEFDLRYRRA